MFEALKISLTPLSNCTQKQTQIVCRKLITLGVVLQHLSAAFFGKRFSQVFCCVVLCCFLLSVCAVKLQERQAALLRNCAGACISGH